MDFGSNFFLSCSRKIKLFTDSDPKQALPSTLAPALFCCARLDPEFRSNQTAPGAGDELYCIVANFLWSMEIIVYERGNFIAN